MSFLISANFHCKTRMHSSRMRTARALTVSPSMLYAEWGCVHGLRVYLVGVGVVYLVGGCTWSGGGGVPGLVGGAPGLRGVYLVWGSAPGLRGVYLVWGTHLVWGVYLVLGRCTWSGEGVYLVWGCTWSWGVYLVPGGVPGPVGGTCSGGGHLLWGDVPGPGGLPRQVLPPCGQNHRRL